MLAASVAGETDPATWAAWAPGRLREKRAARAAALAGRVQAHHRCVRGQLLTELDHPQAAGAACDTASAAA